MPPSQERRGVVSREAAQQVLLEVGPVGPIGVDFVPGQPVAPAQDEEHAWQVHVQLADRLLGDLAAGLVLFATRKVLEGVEEDDRRHARRCASGAAR